MMKRYIGNILLGVSMVAFILTLIFSLFQRGKEDVFFLGYKPFLIASGSMEPEYRINAAVLIKKVGFDSIEIGDVVAFKGIDNRTVFHRVIAEDEDGFITKGDNNEYADSIRVTNSNFIGIGVYKTNITATISSMLSTTKGVIFYVIIPICSYFVAKISYRIYKAEW